MARQEDTLEGLCHHLALQGVGLEVRPVLDERKELHHVEVVARTVHGGCVIEAKRACTPRQLTDSRFAGMPILVDAKSVAGQVLKALDDARRPVDRPPSTPYDPDWAMKRADRSL